MKNTEWMDAGVRYPAKDRNRADKLAESLSNDGHYEARVDTVCEWVVLYRRKKRRTRRNRK